MVLCCGVFDVLHAGHLQLLEQARSLGSTLVVGINSDHSVRKGPGRPVNTAEDRAAMLREQIASREQMGKDANDLRRELANLTAGIQRDAERGRNERADADRKSREAVAAAKTDATAETKAQGADSLDALMAQLRSSYGVLKDSGGITSTDASGLDNAQAAVQSSAPGQFLGRVFGTKNQSERNSIAQTRPLLLAAIKDATGMSAQEMNSNVELQLTLDTLTDPTQGIEAARMALADLEELYGLPKAAAPARAGRGQRAPNRTKSGASVSDW